jgi:hypothetical protein
MQDLEEVPDVVEDEVLGVVDEEPEYDDPIEEEVEEQPEEEEDEVTLDGEVLNAPDPEEKKAPRWVKDLRKAAREKDRKIRELEERLNQGQQQAPQAQVPELGPEPTLDDDDVDYDQDKFKAKYKKWVSDSQKHEIELEKQKATQKEAQEAFQTKLVHYNERKAKLSSSGFDDAEENVVKRFSVVQQNLILEGVDDPALLVLAIGKSPKRLEALSKITNRVRFAVELGKLEKDLKVVKRKPSASPEKAVEGHGKTSGAMNSTLDKLRAKAYKTGKFEELHNYIRNNRE